MSKKNKHHSLLPPKEDPVHIPPVEESWLLMQQMLDNKMPVRSWHNRFGRWPMVATTAVVAITSLLIWLASRKTTHPAPGRKQPPAVIASKPTEPAPHLVPGASTSPGASTPPDESASSVPGNSIHTHPAETSRTSSLPAKMHISPNSQPLTHHRPSTTGPANESSLAGSTGRRHTHTGLHPLHRPSSAEKEANAGSERLAAGPGISEPRAFDPVRLAKTNPGLSNSFFRKTDSLLNKLAANNKKGAGKDKKASPRAQRGILMTAGLSITENFPIGQQQSVSRNGKGNLLWDYMPAPYFRYYADDKIYLEGTVRIISPQDIRAVQVDSTGDTTSFRPITGPYLRVSKTTLTKLYYTDLSVTAHYRIAGGLYFGAGLQFSRLMNAIATKTVRDQPSRGIGLDTLISSGSILLKTDSAYGRLRKDDWRVLFEVSYQWKRFTAALRYQRAISSYLPVMPDGSRGKEKNAAFGIDLRYELWQRRRHK